VILKNILKEILFGGVGWIVLAKDGGGLGLSVNAVTTEFDKMWGIS
jgi:hypothetical protein